LKVISSHTHCPSIYLSRPMMYLRVTPLRSPGLTDDTNRDICREPDNRCVQTSGRASKVWTWNHRPTWTFSCYEAVDGTASFVVCRPKGGAIRALSWPPFSMVYAICALSSSPLSTVYDKLSFSITSMTSSTPITDIILQVIGNVLRYLSHDISSIYISSIILKVGVISSA